MSGPEGLQCRSKTCTSGAAHDGKVKLLEHVARNWLAWLARTVSQHISRYWMSLANSAPRCIPPSEGCPRIIASTRLLHTERRFGITLAAAANGPMVNAAFNKMQRDTKGTTNHRGLLTNHQHPTVILKEKLSHNYQRWHWNHSKMIAIRNWKRSYLSHWGFVLMAQSILVLAYSYYTLDIHSCTLSCPKSRMQPLVSGPRRLLTAALALKSWHWCLWACLWACSCATFETNAIVLDYSLTTQETAKRINDHGLFKPKSH